MGRVYLAEAKKDFSCPSREFFHSGGSNESGTWGRDRGGEGGVCVGWGGVMVVLKAESCIFS